MLDVRCAAFNILPKPLANPACPMQELHKVVNVTNPTNSAKRTNISIAL
jgi:hypothetical protein